MSVKTHVISEHIKQFFVKIALRIVRLLVSIKPLVLRVLKLASSPFAWIGRFFILLAIPFVRLFSSGRRSTQRLYKPAKNKLMVFVTHRYVVHAVVVALVGLTIFANARAGEVRAQTFGQQSLMYRIVAQKDDAVVEEVAYTEPSAERLAVNYLGVSTLSSFSRGIDYIQPQAGASPLVGGGSIVAVPVSGTDASQAPRTTTETYVVQSGDTFSTIAERFDISLNTLLWANNLTVRSVLKPGDSLVILPVTGVSHTVASGDTLSAIANKYGVDASEIIAYNDISGSTLSVGQQVIIPGGEVQAPAPVQRRTTIAPTTSTIPTTTSTASPTVSGSGSMVWPTDLRIITQYYGWSHTGVDIDCHFTNDNYAADDGIVQFAGWKGGYGYTVEVNHGNGIVTRYGHHSKIYVTAGQQVSKGQAVGQCGTTGRSTGTHLHFEVIVNGGFRNPLEYIR